MSSIFNLFGSVTPKNQQLKIDTYRDTNSITTKGIGKIHENLTNNKLQANNVVIKKQKGLSIRSKVDPNVCTTNVNNVSSKNNQLLKPVFKKNEELQQQIGSIKKKTSTKNQIQSPAPHSKSPNQNTNSNVNFTFKKPITPKKTFGYPEPEYLIGLKNWTEEQRFYRPSYDDIIQESMFNKCQDKSFVIPEDDDDNDDDYKLIPKIISTSDLSYPSYDEFENENFKLIDNIDDIEPPKMPSVSDNEF